MDKTRFKEQLEHLLVARIPGCLSLLSVERLSGGASQESYRIEIDAEPHKRTLALRRGMQGTEGVPGTERVPGTEGVPGTENQQDMQRPGLAGEAQLMRSARLAGVPAPEVYYVLEPEDGLGMGFLMEWIEGEALGSRIVRRPEFAAIRPRLAYEIGRILARIHSIDITTAELSPYLHTIPATDFISQTWDRYKALKLPHPMIDYTARWLIENLVQTQDLVLVHNDFRNGNFMITPERIVAVLDWEAAHIGDPMRDLGWICTNSWRYGSELPVGGFGEYDDLFRGYEEVSGKKVNRDQVKFWQVFGSFWWAVTCFRLASESRNIQDSSIERASIGRRASEAMIDCVNLLIPGPIALIEPDKTPNQLDLPGADELVTAVSELLRDDIMSETKGRTNFLSRVAANSLDIVGREFSLLPEHRRRELDSLRKLNIADSQTELVALRWGLVEALRDGSQSLDDGQLQTHLRNTVANQLAIDQPHYSGLKQALEFEQLQ